MSKLKLKTIATLTIVNGRKLTDADRRLINNWLRQQGRKVVKHGNTFPAKYEAKF